MLNFKGWNFYIHVMLNQAITYKYSIIFDWELNGYHAVAMNKLGFKVFFVEPSAKPVFVEMV